MSRTRLVCNTYTTKVNRTFGQVFYLFIFVFVRSAVLIYVPGKIVNYLRKGITGTIFLVFFFTKFNALIYHVHILIGFGFLLSEYRPIEWSTSSFPVFISFFFYIQYTFFRSSYPPSSVLHRPRRIANGLSLFFSYCSAIEDDIPGY